MAQREIKLSLVYRDMWQSSGKYQPRKDQLERIAPVLVEMGCFARVETNGGAFEQVNLLYGENPNKAVRAFTKPLNEAGIQTHMRTVVSTACVCSPSLLTYVACVQGQEGPGCRYHPYLRRAQRPPQRHPLHPLREGSWDDPTGYALYHPLPRPHLEYYADLADQFIAAGAPEICLKDMAGIGRPRFLGRLVKAIKTKHPEVINRVPRPLRPWLLRSLHARGL